MYSQLFKIKPTEEIIQTLLECLCLCNINDNTEFTIDNIVESLLELHRFPILVMLPDNEPFWCPQTSNKAPNLIFLVKPKCI